MKKIKLTRNKYALVDDGDFEYLNQHRWYCTAGGYAQRDVGGRKNKKRILMHRLLNKTPEGFSTDHINRDKLDNRKCNLRSVTQSQNGFNRGLNKNNTSGHRGVYWYQNSWVAEIKVNFKKIHIGRFKDLVGAVSARKTAEEIYFI